MPHNRDPEALPPEAEAEGSAPRKNPANKSNLTVALVFLFNAVGVFALAAILYLLSEGGGGRIFSLALLPVALLQLGLFGVFYGVYRRGKTDD